MTKQILLIILDGWGYRKDKVHNAVLQSKIPNFDALWNKYPHSLLQASGEYVGLPDGQMGNSEIGHMTIGAGKVIATDLVRIAHAIKNNEFKDNHAFVKLFNHVKKYDSTLHIKGLLSPGGVHSHEEHLFAFLKAAKEVGIKKIAIHVFTDGRDTPPQSAAESLEKLENLLKNLDMGHIASASGRFYAMDRDNNWDRLKKAEDAMFNCKGNICKNIKPSEFIRELYKTGVKDELLEPIVFLDENNKGYKIEKNDGVFFFNFRSDRARMLSQKIVDLTSTKNLCYVTLTEYNKTIPTDVAFPTIEIKTTLAKEISKHNLTQAHIAETEKFPHATYFLNGGQEKPHKKEKHIMLDSHKKSPKTEGKPFTHDYMPKMRAEAIADKAIKEIENGTNFIFINFANPDMVGHTANVPAIIEAIEEVDTQLGRVTDALFKKNGVAFITADHGNAEVNIDPITGAKHTSHTINPVPAILTKKNIKFKSGSLADITPTILKLFNIPKPKEMTGKSLI
ncbi:MAG: 2,3-bisphosphoglycerate-independent phosphoglycerate mutase [Candidatus Taylorbacteria bacterium]|nr:2,3-bisphosphoglycerate-independent phosphoglycerate mutase [Candidatus Taylorbacteria bacterium]